MIEHWLTSQLSDLPAIPGRLLGDVLPSLLASRDQRVLQLMIETSYHADSAVAAYTANSLELFDPEQVRTQLLPVLSERGPNNALGYLFSSRGNIVLPIAAQEIFYLRTTLVISEPDFPITSAKGTTWKFDLLDWNFDLVDSFLYWNGGSSLTYFIVLGIRTLDIAVVGLLSAWVSERWVLRDAEACSADSVSIMAGCLRYSFRDRLGEYYGGDAFPFASVRSPKLARIVFYRAAKPELNKIAIACIFHRLVIVGRGLTDLDEATVAGHPVKAQPASQPL